MLIYVKLKKLNKDILYQGCIIEIIKITEIILNQ